MKPGVLDYVVVALFLLREIFEWRWNWPHHVQAIRARVPGARNRLYRTTIISLWMFTLFVLTRWIVRARPWSALWLGTADPWRLSIGVVAVAIAIAFFVLQGRKVQKVLARPKAVARLREQLEFANSLAPETSSERRGFWLLSITAGICEEILFRGFLMWLIAQWTGLITAVILSSVPFGCMHIYLGAAYVPKVTVVGLMFALIVVASGSLWPAIVIHTAMDLSSGEISFRVAQASAAISNLQPVTS
jgi:CAAX protease family protein